MCKWIYIRRIFCGKKPEPVRCSVQSASSLMYVHTSQQFCEEFTRQLTEDNLRELSRAFHMIAISPQTISKTFFQFMNRRGFRRLFKTELQTYQRNFKTPKCEQNSLSNCLKIHCFAVLSTYLDMVDYFYDPLALDEFLQHIASSHSFISDPRTSLEIHNILLRQFMKQEFGKYMGVFTRRALKKYLKLINSRLKVLIEQYSQYNDFEDTAHAMDSQRSVLRSKIDGLENFREIYVNDNPVCGSQSSFIPFEAIYPGTSKGRKLSLDRRSP